MISWILRTYFQGNYKTLLLSIVSTIVIVAWVEYEVLPLFADPIVISEADLTTQDFDVSSSKNYSITGRIIADTGWTYHLSQKYLFITISEETTYYSIFSVGDAIILAQTNSWIEPSLQKVTITGNVYPISGDEYDIAQELRQEAPELASSFVGLKVIEVDRSFVDYFPILFLVLFVLLTLTGYYTFFRNKILSKFTNNAVGI